MVEVADRLDLPIFENQVFPFVAELRLGGKTGFHLGGGQARPNLLELCVLETFR